MDCFRVSAVKSLIHNSGACYETGFFAPAAASQMSLAQDQLVAKMRPQLIPLVESFAIEEIPSNIGNKFGDIYEM